MSIPSLRIAARRRSVSRAAAPGVSASPGSSSRPAARAFVSNRSPGITPRRTSWPRALRPATSWSVGSALPVHQRLAARCRILSGVTRAPRGARRDARRRRASRRAPRGARVTPLRILHLAANRWWTGSADPTLQLVAGLRARGHEVLLGVIPGDRFETKAREAGLELLPGLALTPGAAARDTLRLRAAIRSEGIDIVHAHHSHDHWLGLIARPAVSGRGRPRLVRTFHNLRAVRRDRLGVRLYRRTAAVFAVSRQIEARCREVGIAAERVHWIPGSADLARFA